MFVIRYEILDFDHDDNSSLYRISRMGGGVPAGLVGTFLHWRNQKFRIFSNSKIFKKC